MEINNYIVYVQTDINNRITSINSSAFLSDTTDWIAVDEGLGDKYHHAQGNYLPKSLIDSNGCYNYTLIDGVVTERTDADKQAEIDARPAPPPSEQDRIDALESALLELIMGGTV